MPGGVGYVIVSVPRQSVLELLDNCATKKVRTVRFFTAGFSETGKPEWCKLEEQVVQKARQSGIRISGPNCIGIYSPDHKIPYGPSSRFTASGSVGFLSQSGGIADKLMEIGIAWRINYNKGVSFSNGIDLDAGDFLQYLSSPLSRTSYLNIISGSILPYCLLLTTYL